MIRTASFVAAALLCATFAATNAQAQAKKKSAKCPANFHAACMKRCVGAGGQPRFCPQYCEKRKMEMGC